jgi:hypothetical protein
MKKFFTLLLLVIPSIMFSQFTVVSTLPANNATNVPLQTTISITFSEALDTNAMNSEEIWFSNVDFEDVVSYGYSADLKTNFGVYNLQPNTSYFIAFTYAKALSGATITTPFVYYFTTGPSFPPYSVSGTLVSGTTGVSPANAIVGLLTHHIFDTEGRPNIVGWANVNSNGTFAIPNVKNGTYWLIAAKDVNGNGVIDPDHDRDAIAFSDSIVVNNASVTNVILEFIDDTPLSYHQAVVIADSMANLHLPTDRVLRYVQTWGVDTLGRGIGNWYFVYTGKNNTVVYEVPGSKYGGGVDSILEAGHVSWVAMHKPITNHAQAAPSLTVITNTENAGGRDFRALTVPPDANGSIEMVLGGHTVGDFYTQVPDTNLIYWQVRYIWELEQPPWIANGRKFLCNFSTGAVLLNQSMSVRDRENAPLSFELFQNYPNPFNPTTTITFTVPSKGQAVLSVFNLLGQKVATVFDGIAEPGSFTTAQFNAAGLSSGIYVTRLEFNGRIQMRKMMLLK